MSSTQKRHSGYVRARLSARRVALTRPQAFEVREEARVLSRTRSRIAYLEAVQVRSALRRACTGSGADAVRAQKRAMVGERRLAALG